MPPGTSVAFRRALQWLAGTFGESSLKHGVDRAAKAAQKRRQAATIRRERTMHVEDAIRHAREIGGLYSEDVPVADKPRQIVWLDGRALFAYPMLTEGELDGKPLGDHVQFQNFPKFKMKEPPPEPAPVATPSKPDAT